MTGGAFGRWGRRLGLAAALAAFLPAAEPALDLAETVAGVPVTLKAMWGGAQTRTMFITVFRPRGQGPFPLVVISHGRAAEAGQRATPAYFRFEDAARYFVRKGFVVLVPTRLGYGATGPGFDPEDSGAARSRDYRPMVTAAATEILAAVDYGRTLAGVDAGRIVLVGQSVGGLSTVAAAADNPPGLVAAINFAGGAGGDPDHHPGVPTQAGQLEDLYAEMGRRARAPMLWIYTENDRFFEPRFSRAWAQAFAKAGGQVEFRLLPAFKENGHHLFAQGCDIWMPVVEAFLAKAGFRDPGLIPRPQATHFAEIGAVGQVPYLGEAGREGYRKFLEAPMPRAFAVSRDGHWGYASGDDALSRALGNAQRGGGEPARLYAVDGEVVW